MLATLVAGMPLYLNSTSIYGTAEKYTILPPDYGPIPTPIPLSLPPTCIMEMGTVIHMTSATIYNIGDSINLDNYFYDPDTKDLTYSVEYPETFTKAVLNNSYLESITTYFGTGESRINVFASDGLSTASYEFILRVDDRASFNLEEDTPVSFDVSQLMPFTVDQMEIDCSTGINATLDYQYYVAANLDIAPEENWWGEGTVALSVYDEPYSIPMPPPDYTINSIGVYEPVFTFGYFEFDIGVSPVNDPPMASTEDPYRFVITEETSAEFPCPFALGEIFADVDSQPRYTWYTQNGLASFEIINSDIISLNSGNVVGEDVLTIIANDEEYVATFDISVSVTPKTAIDMTEDTVSAYDIGYFADLSEQEIMTFESENIVIDVISEDYASPIVNLTPGTDWFGSDSVSVILFPKVNDINPPLDTNTVFSEPPGPSIPPLPSPDIMYEFYEFNVNVGAVNDPPYVLTEPSVSMYEDGTIADAFNLIDCFDDVDSDLEYSLLSTEGYLTAETEFGGEVDIASVNNWFGTGMVNIAATDGEYTAILAVPVQVLPVNDVPFATDSDSNIAFEEDGNISVNLGEFISDVEDALWFSYVCNDANSTIALNETTWEMTVTPDENWNGVIGLTVYGSDGEAELARDLICNVTPVNDAPIVSSNEDIVMEEGTEVDLDLSTYITDVDSELQFTLFSCRGRLQCTQSDGATWALCPSNCNWFGLETIRAIAYDGQYMLAFDLNVEVMPVNNAPVQSSQITGATFAEDSVFSVMVEDLFEDVDGDVLEYTFETTTSLEQGFSEETGMLTITPSKDWSGESTVRITASDGITATSIDIAMTVSPLNDAPNQVETVPSVVLAVGNSTNVSLAGLFSDIDSYVLSIEVVGTESLEVTAMDANGVFNVRSLDSWEGSQTLVIRVSDGTDVTETSMTVTTYIPDITMEESSAGGNVVNNAYWMLCGMAAAVIVFVAYSATEARRLNSGNASRKGSVL